MKDADTGIQNVPAVPDEENAAKAKKRIPPLRKPPGGLLLGTAVLVKYGDYIIPCEVLKVKGDRLTLKRRGVRDDRPSDPAEGRVKK